MRLYAPAKPSSSTGEEDGRRQEQDIRSSSSFQTEDKNYRNNYDSRRPVELTRRSLENDPRLDDKLQLNAPRLDDNKAQPIHPPRLDEKILTNGPPSLGDEPSSAPPMTPVNVDSVISSKKSPPTKTSTPPIVSTTAVTTTQNGPNSIDLNPPPLENGTDSLRSLDSIPWNLEGTETIIKNGSKPSMKNGSISSEEDELKKLREENKKLKAALEEAAEVNGQWRQYHDERQGYVQRLLTTIHELQHAHQSTAPSPRQLDGEGGTGGQEGEVRRLREALTRLQADHHEHVQLLEMQVRAHRDDWEAERSEKRSAEAALAETEARAALLLQELQLLQAKLADSESKRSLCWRCLCPRTDFNNHRSGSNSAPRTPQASPIPAPGGGASPAPVIPSAPPPDNPPVPLKGWIPVSMLHQIAFSGATPEHQTPVVQSQPHSQQPNRTYAPVQPQNLQNHQQQHIQQSQSQQQPQKPCQQQSQQQQTQVKQHLQVQQQPRVQQHQVQNQQQRQSTLNCMPKPVPLSSASNNIKGSDFMQNSTYESSAVKVGNMIGCSDDKKRYEAMGARPKVLGDLHAVTAKGIGIIEDEKSAKHRARSILASAIPVSPVSSGPSTPCGISVTRSSSNMPKGYVPITSTVLTPINFRPPFVAHKRPSAVKHMGQGVKGSSHVVTPGIGNIAPPTHVRSESSPASLFTTNNSNANMAKNLSSTPNKKQTNDSSLLPNKIGKPSSCNTQNMSHLTENARSLSSNTKSVQVISSNSNTSRDNENTPSIINRLKSNECSDGISIVTTTISCSSPCTLTTTTSSSQVNVPDQNQSSRSSETSVPHTSLSTTSNVTAFASITVTTTAANHANSNNTTSTYSSSTSSRSSSPGISLTTFGLNSEGRGIPGAICFALGSDQKGTRSPQHCASPRRTSNSSVRSPVQDVLTSGQSQKDVKPPTGVKSPTIIINNTPPTTTVKEEHWWSVESPGRSKQQSSQSGKLVNSTWVRLMGGQANNRPGSGLPWRTARAVSGQHLNQARKASQDEGSNGTTSPNSVSSSTATFNYTPAVNSPPSSNLSSATNSAPSSPPPNPNHPHSEDLKSMASKNISSAILSYELSAKCEPSVTSTESNMTQSWSGSGKDSSMNDGVVTMTRRDLVCPSCQMLFPPEKHLEFLDHFEVCRGPEYADL